MLWRKRKSMTVTQQAAVLLFRLSPKARKTSFSKVWPLWTLQYKQKYDGGGEGGRSLVVRELEFKSKDPGFDPLVAGQG